VISRDPSGRLLATLREQCAVALWRNERKARQWNSPSLYFARFPCGIVKVGLTSGPERRRQDIAREALRRRLVASVDEFEFTVLPGCGDLERQAHRVLALERVEGEWFRGPLSFAMARCLEAIAKQPQRKPKRVSNGVKGAA
jgi:hypothetical protein